MPSTVEMLSKFYFFFLHLADQTGSQGSAAETVAQATVAKTSMEAAAE